MTLRTIPPRELPRAAWRRLRRSVRQRTAPREPRPTRPTAQERALAETLREREAPHFFGLFAGQASLAAEHFPEAWRATLAQATAICAHRFDLLGSGPVDLGERIDWHTDFKTEHTWPLVHHTRLTLSAPEGGYDVKVPWELSRFHHALRLGQAYRYSDNEEYAREIVAQVEDWIARNPAGFGVNWAGPMDVAIRAVNWIWAYHLIQDSRALTGDFLALWLASLRQHGEYLLRNLEDGWPRTNHLIADLTGLAYLGILFPELPGAARWRAVGLGRLWAEIERQVYADGVDYEASTGYHRLVTEMALSVAGLCVANDIPIPAVARARLALMLDAIAVTTQPDGTVPAIGDADDGRLHPLTVHPDPARMAADHRHLLALGSVVLDRQPPCREEWAAAAGDEWQDAFWFFPAEAADCYFHVMGVRAAAGEPPPPIRQEPWPLPRPQDAVVVQRQEAARLAASRAFEAGGLYVMRSGDFHATIRAGDIGQDGAGGHAHNDALSLTLCAYGRTFLIDPGSYTYTADPAARDAFRATAAHNTLQVAGAEINRLPGEPFRLADDARVTLHRWTAGPAVDVFDASHDGYARLSPGAIHRRQVWFDRAAGLWLLHDRLLPTGNALAGEADELPEVDVTLRFHFAPMPLRLDRSANTLRTDTPAEPNLILMPLGHFPLQAAIDTGWVAPRYGVREQAPVAKFTGRVKLPADLILLLYPHQGEANFDTVRAAGQSALRTMRAALRPAT